MDLKEHIGLRIRRARLIRGFTQEQLAECTEKTVETISNIERGQTLTGLETLERLGQCLDTPVRDFFEDVEDRDRVSVRRRELETQLGDLAKRLSDDDLTATLEMAQALSRRRGQGTG